MGIKRENVLESAQRVADDGKKEKKNASQKGLCMPMQWFERKVKIVQKRIIVVLASCTSRDHRQSLAKGGFASTARQKSIEGIRPNENGTFI